MKRFSTLILGLLTAFAGTLQAQVLPEGFETLDLDAGGWTATQAEGAAANHKWSVSTYAKETAQFPKNIPTMEVCGEKVLKCTTSGAFNTDGTAPDNRLVTPQITIGDNTWLSFLMACNFAGNAAANITDGGKTHIEIAVSPDGSDDSASFTDIVYSATPVGLNTWMPVSVDLSAYRGKTVRLMFRCYMNELFKSLVANTLYIDNVDLSAAKSTDIKLSNLSGLFKGTIAKQPLSVDVFNNGASDIAGYTLNVKVNGTTASSETMTGALAPGDKYTYKFDVDLAKGDNTVSVEAVAANDCIEANNSVSASTTVEAGVALPFALADDGTQNTQMITTRKGTMTRPAGWTYFTNYSKWIHTTTATGAKAYLYTASPLTLGEGAVKVDLKGTVVTATTAEVEVYLTRRTDDFGTICGSVTVTPDDGEKMLLVNVPEPGDYYVAFGVTAPVTSAQFKLESLSISQATDLPDTGIAAVISPLFAPAGDSTPLSVQIRNEGVGAATGTKVSYTVGETTVTETIPSIAGGATASHTFSTPLTLAEGTHSIKITATTGGDQNASNDVMEVEFTSYAVASLPYRESFENADQSRLWTVVNTNGDNYSWAVADGYEFDGTHIASIPESAAGHNDWIISPAIDLTDGFDGRLSFYYGAGGNKGTARINVYLTKSTDPAAISEGTPLLSLDCDGVNVSYASAPVSGLEAGNYHIAFHAADGGQALLIDDVRMDNNAEIAVTGLSVPDAEPAYDPEPATVRLTLRNYGSQPVSGAKAAYTLYSYKYGESAPEALATVEETIPSAIPAGQEFTYDFTRKIEYTREANYIVRAAVTFPDDGDADSKNNSFQCSAGQRLVTMQTPALWDMEMSDNLAGYTFFAEQPKWRIGAVNPYDGSRSLYHLGNTQAEDGDKVALNRVHLKPGKYQLSFFWQTTRGMEGDDYRQSFDVVMGDSPENMSKVLLSIDNRTAAGKKHAKEMIDLTIDTEGNYFIGFHLRKGAPQGQLVIDNVRIEAPQAKYDMTARTAVYEADFDTRADEWQHYHPLQIVAQQWTVERDATLGLPYMQAIEFSSLGTHYSASWLQAPAMNVRGGCTYTVTLYPEILALAQTGKPLTGTESIVIYRSARDLPGEFIEVGRATPAAGGSYSVSFTPGESGLCYLSLLPYCEEDAAFRIHSFKVEMTAAPDDGNWEPVGTCSFTDPVFSAIGFEPQTMTDVAVERNADVKNQYRLVRPYAKWVVPADKASQFTFTESEMTPIVFDIIDNKYVYVHPFNTGWKADAGDIKGEITCYMQAKNLLDNDLSIEQVIALAPGCLAVLDYDRITATATFPYYGYDEPPVFLARFSDSTGRYAANKQGEFLITLPEEMIPDPFEGWKTVGTAVMTEVFVSGCLDGAERQELTCELQRKDGAPDVYRLVNPYATWKNPDEALFSYDSARPRFLVIHTENAPYAWFENFVTGVSATDGGMISGQCYASDFIEALTLEKAIATVPEAFGRYDRQSFAFPSATCTYQGRELPTVFTRFADTPQSITRCNADNAFKVVFTFNPGSVDSVASGSEPEPEYYTLQGLRIKNPAPGQLVIVRQGSRTYKTFIR